MAAVVVEMSGDEAKLYRAYQRIIDQAQKLEDKNKGLKKTSDDAGKAAEQAFGQRAATAIGNYAAGMFTLQAAAQAFGAAMAYSKASTDSAIASVERLIATRSQLLQVSEGKGGGDVQRMDTFANQLAMRGISRDAAQSLVFSARSENFRGSEDLVARLIGANYMSATDARTFAGQVPGIFDYKVSPIEGIVGAAYGAKVSRLNAAEYSSMLPKAASATELAGGSPAEAFALAALLPRKNERGAEYAATFAGQLATGPAGKQFAGKGVMGMVDLLSSMPESKRKKLLGTAKETNLVYEWLSGALGQEVRSTTSAAAAAMSDAGGFVSGVEGTAFDPSTTQGQIMIGRRANIIASNQLEISREERLAAGGYARRARTAALTERDESGSVGPVSRWLSSKAYDYSEAAGLPDFAAEGAGRIIRTTGFGLLESAASKLGQAADKMLRASDSSSRQRAAANQQPE